MSQEQQRQDGRYHTKLENTPSTREGLYDLVKELCGRDDFRYLIQAIKEGARSDVALNKRNIGDKNLSELLEQHYQNGFRNIEVGFTTENSVVAKPPVWYEKVLSVKDELERTYSKLDIDFGRFRIHAYTNDGSIGKKLRSLSGVITYKGPDSEIDMRNIWVKLGLYLLKKMGKPVSFLRSAKRMS